MKSVIEDKTSDEDKAKKIDNILFKNDSDNSVPTLLKNKRFETALIVINAAVDEAVEHTNELFKKMDKKIMKALAKVIQ